MPQRTPALRIRDTNARDVVRRAFAEFLALPSLIICAFALLALGTSMLDRSALPWLEPLSDTLRLFLSDSTATANLLATIAGSLITVTSITISLLLLAVQQAAGTMTAQVFDQFLRRRHNQFHFGFLIGLSLFALVTLASVDEPFNPVFGAATALVLTIVALFLLIVLLYAVIDQMRPIEIIDMIHNQILRARQRQQLLLQSTGETARRNGATTIPVHARRHGFVTGIDVARIEAAHRDGVTAPEVILHISIGSFVAFQDLVAEVCAASPQQAHQLSEAVEAAVHIERQRDISVDPAYGIAQLETIAWTSISTAKSDPATGVLSVYALRDLLARWSAESGAGTRADGALVIYSDTTLARLMSSFETLAVVASESMQHQSLTAILNTFVVLFARLPDTLARRTEDLILRILPSLGDHVLTSELDHALSSLTTTLTTAGRMETASAVDAATRRFAETIGQFGSRSTRAR